jgi:hypothetical protein
MNPFFDWLKDPGTQAMLVLLSLLAAAIAAAGAIYFGKKSLTKKDLEQVEKNTEHLEEVRSGIASMNARLNRQDEIERLQLQANRIAIIVAGKTTGNTTFRLDLHVGEATGIAIAITDVGLYNEHENFFGSFVCTRVDGPNTLYFCAEIPMAHIGTWFRAGTVDQSFNRMRLKLKVGMSMDGVAVSREMAIVVIGTNSGGYILEGRV